MASPFLASAGTFIANLMTKGGKGFSDGMNYMGDFDPEGFVNANLERAKNTPGTQLPQVIQGITRLVGLGPKKMIGSPESSTVTPTGKLDQKWFDSLFKDSTNGG